MGFKLDYRGDSRWRNPTPVLVCSEPCFRIRSTVWGFQWGVTTILLMQSFKCKSSSFYIYYLLLTIIAHYSSGSSSPEKCLIVVHQIIAQLIPFHRKNPFGLCIVAACSFGIFVIASVNQVKKKRELSRLTKLFLKPKLLKIPWTHIDATWTRPWFITVGNISISTLHNYPFWQLVKTVIRLLSIRMLVAQALRRYVSRCPWKDIY